MTLTSEQADTLTSFADGEHRVMNQTGWTYPQLKEAALDSGIERCPCCGWWCECGELIPIDEDEPDGHCGNCRVLRDL